MVKEEGTDEDEGRNDKRQDSELPTLDVSRNNSNNANEANNNASNKSSNRMEQTTQTGTQSVHNRRRLFRETMAKQSGTELFNELHIAFQHGFHVGIAIVTRDVF